MKFKIEKKPVTRNKHYHGDWGYFLIAIKTLKVGESFVSDRVDSNHRIILSSCKILMDRAFACAKEGDKFRVGRIG